MTLAAGAVDARAYVLMRVPAEQNVDQPAIRWHRHWVSWRSNEAGSVSVGQEAALEAIRLSFAAWNEIDCSDLTLIEESPTRSIAVGYDSERPDANENLVVFRETLCSEAAPDGDPCWPDECPSVYGCWNDRDPELVNVIGLTTPTYYVADGKLVDADIELAGAKYLFTVSDGDTVCPPQGPFPPNCVARDIRNTVTHEVGHFLGLDHSADTEATMYGLAANGETKKRTLEQDDKDGYCALYQPLESGCGCASTSPGAFWSLPLALVPLARRRSRSSNSRTPP